MTHISNVPHILVHGITHRDSANTNPKYTPIGDPTLISSRSAFVLDNGRRLGEYIPFYFGPRMPMLYVIQCGFNGVSVTPPQDIVYCVTSIQKVIDTNLEFAYTDGHAVDSFSTQYGSNEVANIEKQVDFEAVKTRDWIKPTDLDLKRRMQAEFLLSGDLPIQAVLGFLVYDESTKEQLLQFGVSENQIRVKPNAYF